MGEGADCRRGWGVVENETALRRRGVLSMAGMSAAGIAVEGGYNSLSRFVRRTCGEPCDSDTSSSSSHSNSSMKVCSACVDVKLSSLASASSSDSHIGRMAASSSPSLKSSVSVVVTWTVDPAAKYCALRTDRKLGLKNRLQLGSFVICVQDAIASLTLCELVAEPKVNVVGKDVMDNNDYRNPCLFEKK